MTDVSEGQTKVLYSSLQAGTNRPLPCSEMTAGVGMSPSRKRSFTVLEIKNELRFLFCFFFKGRDKSAVGHSHICAG